MGECFKEMFISLKLVTSSECFFQAETLQKQRESRKAEWQRFINDMSEKCKSVDKSFQEKENELRESYAELEKKLHIGQ